MSSSKKSEKKKISLESLNEYERKERVNTPRSLEACYREGIDPSELLYRPPEDFYEAGLSPRIQELNYNLFEAKRKDSLQLAREARVKILEGLDKRIQKSFTEPNFSINANFQTQVERAKEKKLKAIKRLVEYETQATETILEFQAKERERKEAEERRKRYLLTLGKQKGEEQVKDMQRIKEQQVEMQVRKQEKQARKKAAKLFAKQMKEEEQRRQMELEEAKSRAQFLQQSEEKRKAKLQEVEQRRLEQKHALEQKLMQENLLEIERKKAIQSQQEKLRARLRSRSQENEAKRKRAIDNFEKKLEEVRKNAETGGFL